jgi:hypothetical protein
VNGTCIVIRKRDQMKNTADSEVRQTRTRSEGKQVGVGKCRWWRKNREKARLNRLRPCSNTSIASIVFAAALVRTPKQKGPSVYRARLGLLGAIPVQAQRPVAVDAVSDTQLGSSVSDKISIRQQRTKVLTEANQVAPQDLTQTGFAKVARSSKT